MTELTPPRDTTDTEALVEFLISVEPEKQHGQLCPVWVGRNRVRYQGPCDCWQRRFAKERAEALLTSDWLATRDAALRAEAWDEGLRFGQLHWATNYAGVYENGSPLRPAPNPYRNPYDDPDRPSGHTRSCAAVGCGPECEAPR